MTKIETDLEEIKEAFQELSLTLAKILDWLEDTEVYLTSHGAHSDAVEARKLLDRLGVE
jgi:hypothetical protein